MFANDMDAYTALHPGLKHPDLTNVHLFRSLLRTNPRCFHRDDFAPGHITASTWITNLNDSGLLLIMHPHLKMWMSPGGHSDGDMDTYATALRELEEETGYTPAMVQSAPAIFDLDIHPVPANTRRNEPEHLHFDVRYHVRVDDKRPIPGSAEGIEARWFTVEEAAPMFPVTGGRWRMLQKTLGR
jgi:8-oxo-dGTP pyrophosphatase MutT (NUDIX family)